jgi:hypothetical protein
VIVRGRPRVGPAETAKTACDAVVEKPCKIGKHSPPSYKFANYSPLNPDLKDRERDGNERLSRFG